MNSASCRNVLPLLLRCNDGSLNLRHARALDAHLARCPACRARAVALTTTREAVARHARAEEQSAALLAAPGPARRAIAQWLAEQQPSRPLAARTSAARRFALRPAPAAATAAFVLAGLAGGAFLLRPAASGKRHAAVPSPTGGKVVAAATLPSFTAAAPPHVPAPVKQNAPFAQTVAAGSPNPWSLAAPSPRRGRGNVPALDFARPAPPLTFPAPAEAPADDLGYLNPDPARFAARWTFLAPTEADALEARLRASVRGGDGRFVSIPLPRVASAGGSFALEAAAVAAYRREAQIVDARLQRKVTLALKNVAFSDLCDELSKKTDVKFSAARGVADDKITLFCTDRPLRDILRQISALFNFSWERSGEEGEYAYRLNQSLRAQLLEEELRNRDKNDAILALDKEMDAFRKYLDLTPEQARALAKNATGDEKERLDALGGSLWGATHLYFGLSPDEQAALRNGDTLRWGDAPGGESSQPLPPDLAQSILQSQGNNTRILVKPDGEAALYMNSDPAGLVGKPGLPPAQVAGARALAQLKIQRNELGQYSMSATGGVAMNKSATMFGADIASGVSPSVRDPKNAEANARLKSDPDLAPLVSLHPEPSCPAATEKPALPKEGEKSPPSHTDVTSADVLEAIHKATSRDVIGDSYARLYPAASVSVEKTPLFDALNRVSDTLRLRWNKETDAPAKTSWLTFRSTSFFNDRLKEVPNRLYARWSERRQGKSSLPLADLLAIAQLSDAQLDSGAADETARKCYGISEWPLVRFSGLREHWRFLAALPAGPRASAMSDKGLRFLDLPLARQQEFAALVFGARAAARSRPDDLVNAVLQNAGGSAGEAPDGDGGVRLDDLLNATLRVTFAPDREKDPVVFTYDYNKGKNRRRKTLTPNSSSDGIVPPDANDKKPAQR